MTAPDVLRILDEVAVRLPEVPRIVLADRDDAGEIVEALRHGVRGYIPTNVASSVAIGALKLVQVGGTFVPVSVLAALEGRSDAHAGTTEGAGAAMNGEVELNGGEMPHHEAEPGGALGLTARQLQVLSLLRQGRSNKIIAYELQVQESTVKVHVRQIMRKLKATNRTQAAFLANRLRWPVRTGEAKAHSPGIPKRIGSETRTE